MKKPNLTVEYDEILKEITDLQAQSPDGFATWEMMKATGRSEQWCRAKLRLLMREGKAKCVGKRTAPSIDGRITKIPVYSLTRG